MGNMNNVYASAPLNLDRAQRQTLGRTILGASAFLFIISVLAGTTHLLDNLGLTWQQSRQLSGVLGGIAIPTLISGVFFLLPSSHAERQLAAIGITVSLVGVILFTIAYPTNWNTSALDMTFLVVAVYFLGTFTAFSAMFFAASNIKIHTPSSVILKTVREGAQNVLDDTPTETPTTQQEDPQPQQTQNSGVAFMGDIPSDDPDSPHHQDDAIILGEDSEDPPQMIDEYCGNCKHFSYQRVGDERQPYCGLHDELMDNLDPCDDWEQTDDSVSSDLTQPDPDRR